MRGRRRREAEVFSLSFLDCICCGFGAIILLLVLSKLGEPKALEKARVDLDALIAALQQELFEIRGETTVLNREMQSRVEQLSEAQTKVARLRGDLSTIQGEFRASKELSEVNDIVEGRLVEALQKLTDEMKRLQAEVEESRHARRFEGDLVGGIPVDSEYVIFIIDTSGSMKSYAWPLAVKKMAQVLDIYPHVKGIQVMNDDGQYMFSAYAGKWIPDSPARRKAILERLRGWDAVSNSSPVEGIERAIKVFATPDRQISLYVFGDEFTGDSISEVVHTVRKMNRHSPGQPPRVRIHAIGFPTVFSEQNVSQNTGIRFSTLMRILCDENAGTFVGLNDIK
jgi:hypothetical protein